MKKVALLFTFFTLTIFLYGQDQRLVLLEEFTQASCGPCAGVNPTINSLLNSNPDKITSVWYHTSWPGYDPMNLHNPTEVAARVSLYNVGYVPFSVLDGNFYSGSASGWNINTVNARYAVPSPFSMQLRHEVSAGSDSVYLTLIAKASQDVSGVLAAHSVVIEKLIHFNSAPGSNGEKDFHNVMKKMLPGSSGYTMPTSFEPGDYIIVETSWKFANVYNVNEIAAVGFIQDRTTKEIHQSCNSVTTALVLPYNTDLQVMEVTNLPYSSCLGIITPTVTVRNNGNNTVTSFEVHYSVNDGDVQTYTWNGTLASLKKTVVALPEYVFTPSGNNQIKIYTAAPNTIADEYPKNDTLKTVLLTGAVSSNMVILFLRTDENPEETTWDVKNANGQIIQTGGPYDDPLKIYRDTIDLPAAGCYIFTIYDAGGDGICCANGSGGYELSDNEGTDIRKNGGSFGASETVEWKLNPANSLYDPEIDPEFTVTPNPFSGSATVGFTLNRPEQVSLRLFNTFGRLIKTFDLGIVPAEEQDVEIRADGIPAGLYILQLQAGSKNWSRKVSVTR